MTIILEKNHHELLSFLPRIKDCVNEWQLLDIKLIATKPHNFTIQLACELVSNVFKNTEGILYIPSEAQALLIIRNAKEIKPQALADKVTYVLPEGACDVKVVESLLGRLNKFEMLINLDKHKNLSTYALTRMARKENIVLIADDDLYMRMLVKKGLGADITAHEVIHGGEILMAYKKYSPDILFLDIHMPGKDGLENLQAVLAFDPQAYVVMLSSDSSPENVGWTAKKGAKGFLAKPIDKERLLEYVSECPTIS